LTHISLHRSPFLSIDEWEELQALREAITDAPSSVVPWKMERFSYLFARSLQGKADLPMDESLIR
jgi:hypothetical protein